MPIDDLLERLARYDTPTIANTIELFEVRPRFAGYMDGRIRAAYPDLPPMVGYAATATFRSAAPADSADAYKGLENQLAQMESLPGRAVIVFQDLDDPPVGATFGEVMCGVYRALGAAGLITSGGGRDIIQVHELRFPVFSSTTICSHAYSQTVDVGRPIRVGGLVVRSSDLLHGDANGVTSVPLDIAADVADAAAEYIAAERHVVDYVQQPGQKTAAGIIDHRRTMGEAIAALRRRLSSKLTAKYTKRRGSRD